MSAAALPVIVTSEAPGAFVNVRPPVFADASTVVTLESRAAVIVKAEPPVTVNV